MTVPADHVSTELVMMKMMVFTVIVFSSLKATCVTNRLKGRIRENNKSMNQKIKPKPMERLVKKAKVKTAIKTSTTKILPTTQSNIMLPATRRVKDDCASGPCQYGTCHDEDDGFHCDCIFFSEGNLCNKLKSWAIPAIALASLAVILTWCCCCWWIIGTGKKDESEKTTKRMNQKIKPKPMERLVKKGDKSSL
ncbi:Hypothetical predicted protein [Mytilus galloprovincialis]|uniref:EGF-like domain-containing protein n=1 Tax=Mytilus galloprovincialis TaxID=29158 RepID=A0A8B6GI76_MYTGA|nr:Hypothetical predicted protein [Mytilus galloprovincialis]